MINTEKHKLVVLIILDGWGIAPEGPGNAITKAHTPNLTSYKALYPFTSLHASGEWVGLPKGEDGNSEVGHLNLGAGYIVYQDLPRINMSIADGTFLKNPAFLQAVDHAKKNDSNLHIMGLIGSGGVHSSNEHLYALLNFVKTQNLQKVYLHLFTDGRDSPPNAAVNIIKQIEDRLTSLSVGKIASISGRYYAMDRDKRWDRTEKTYNCLVLGEGLKAKNATAAVQNSYNQNISDEFILPTNIVNDDNLPVSLIVDNDSVIFYNFRIDRPRQLTESFVLPAFQNVELPAQEFDSYAKLHHVVEQQTETTEGFERQKVLKNLDFVTMTEYEKNLPVSIAFPKSLVRNPLASVLSTNDLRHLHITETEKERFVTFYFNGQHEDPYPGEDRVIIPSPKVTTYDQKPEMSAIPLTEEIIKRIKTEVYQFIVINYPNADMVAHTGLLDAGIKSCETVDECVGKVVAETLAHHGAVIITADHGNAEEMLDSETGAVDTEHSVNPVPCHVIAQELKTSNRTLPSGILADIAPTILSLIGINKPSEMTGRNLLG